MQLKFLEYAFEKLFGSEKKSISKTSKEKKVQKEKASKTKPARDENSEIEEKAKLLQKLLLETKRGEEKIVADEKEANHSSQDKNKNPEQNSIEKTKVTDKKNDKLSILEKDAINQILYTFLLTEADFDKLEQFASRLPMKLRNKLKDLEEERRYNELEFISEEAVLKQEREKEEHSHHKQKNFKIEPFDEFLNIELLPDEIKAQNTSHDDAEIKLFDEVLKAQPKDLTKVLLQISEDPHAQSQLLDHCLREMKANQPQYSKKLEREIEDAKQGLVIDPKLQPFATILSMKLESMSKDELKELHSEITSAKKHLEEKKSFSERVNHSREKKVSLQL
jgi:hypothetical protein